MTQSMRKTPAILRSEAGLILVAVVFVAGLFLGAYHAIAGVAEVLTPEKSMAGVGRTFSDVFRP